MCESGTFTGQKDCAKRVYPNLFNGRQPHRSPEDPFQNIEAILIKKLIGSAVEFNSASVAYITVLLKDVMSLTLLNISTSYLLRFYSVMEVPLWKWQFS